MTSNLLTFFFYYLVESQIPEEEKNIGPNDRLIHVYHFTKEAAQNQVAVPVKLTFTSKVIWGSSVLDVLNTTYEPLFLFAASAKFRRSILFGNTRRWNFRRNQDPYPKETPCPWWGLCQGMHMSLSDFDNSYWNVNNFVVIIGGWIGLLLNSFYYLWYPVEVCFIFDGTTWLLAGHRCCLWSLSGKNRLPAILC